MQSSVFEYLLGVQGLCRLGIRERMQISLLKNICVEQRFVFLREVSAQAGAWSWFVAKEDLEFLNLLTALPKGRDCRCVPHAHFMLCWETQGFVYTRQALYPLSPSLCPDGFLVFFSLCNFGGR